jgi:hypothetical protein
VGATRPRENFKTKNQKHSRAKTQRRKDAKTQRRKENLKTQKQDENQIVVACFRALCENPYHGTDSLPNFDYCKYTVVSTPVDRSTMPH